MLYQNSRSPSIFERIGIVNLQIIDINVKGRININVYFPRTLLFEPKELKEGPQSSLETE